MSLLCHNEYSKTSSQDRTWETVKLLKHRTYNWKNDIFWQRRMVWNWNVNQMHDPQDRQRIFPRISTILIFEKTMKKRYSCWQHLPSRYFNHFKLTRSIKSWHEACGSGIGKRKEKLMAGGVEAKKLKIWWVFLLFSTSWVFYANLLLFFICLIDFWTLWSVSLDFLGCLGIYMDAGFLVV